MAAADDHGSEIDDELRDRVGERLDHHHHADHDPRPRAHSVLPPSARRTSYDSRGQPDPHRDRRQSTSVIPAQSWGSPPSQQQQPAPYYTQDAFGAHAYIEPRAPSHPHQMPPPPPPHPHWGYQLPPPQPYPSSSRAPRSPGPYPDPRTQQYRTGPAYYAGAPGYGPPGPPYGPGPGGATVDPNIFKPDPYARHPGMPEAGPPDASRPDVQITYTDDSATKLTQYLRRRCFNCRVTEVRPLSFFPRAF